MRKLFFISILVLMASCKKDDPVILPAKYEKGVLVLNEGLFQQNNASVSFYSLTDQQSYQQVFYSENTRGLGDTANDWAVYQDGDSTYIIIAVDISSQIEIVNANTMKSVAQIPLFDGTNPREPRHIEINGNKAYSCNFDGTVSVINLTSRTVTNTISVGENPDGGTIVDNKLFVANSGGLNFPNYDSTVSVIDMNSETVTNTLDVRINCGTIMSDSEGDIYVLSRGNYSDVTPAMIRINSQTEMVEDSVLLNFGSCWMDKDWIYFIDQDDPGVFRYNCINETLEGNKLIDCTGFNNVYGVYIFGSTIFVVDANGYVNSSTVKAYDLAGTFKFEFTAGLNATDILIN